MTHRERILATIRGEPTDQVPWVPRLDLWYIAQRARGTLPAHLRGLNTAQLADASGVRYHSLRGDFTLERDPRDHLLSGLGFENHPDLPYRVELHGLPVEFRHDQEHFNTLIQTSSGPITWQLKNTRQMQCEGIHALFPLKFPLTGIEECEAIAKVFEHLEVIPTPDAYARYRQRIGNSGLAIAGGPVAASPTHLLLHNLMPQEQFFLAYNDSPDTLLSLARRLEPLFDKILDALMLCEAEIVF
jgi:hypothetical protein